MEAAIDDLTKNVVCYVRQWHGIEPPNVQAQRMAAQLADLIEGYARLRAAPALDDAPGDFAHTLATLRDPDPSTLAPPA